MSDSAVVLDDPLLAASYQAFARYGFQRTTMGDVAELAGMSRPALYLRVHNKEELLRLVADALLDRSLVEARAAAAAGGDLAHRAEAVLLAKLELTLGLAARSEHAAELLGQYYRLAPQRASTYRGQLEGVLAGVLAGSGAGRKRSNALAAALVSAVIGLETDLGRPDRARSLLHELIHAVVAGLDAR